VAEFFPPSPEGAEEVVRRARHRRQAKAGGLGSSALLVVAGVLFASSLQGGSGTESPDRLTTTSTPTAGASAPPSPDARPRPATLPAAPRTQAAGVAPPLVGSTPSPGAASPRPVPPRSTARRVSPITRSAAPPLAQTDLCRDGSTTTSDWCLRPDDPGTVHRGTPARLGGVLCLLNTAKATTLDLPDTREADIETSSYGGGVLWQGGEGLTYRSPGPRLTFAPGQCVRWTSMWDTRDREGFVVPPGDYFMDFGVPNTIVRSGIPFKVDD
jgi:hypothetical protein